MSATGYQSTSAPLIILDKDVMTRCFTVLFSYDAKVSYSGFLIKMNVVICMAENILFEKRK